MIPRRPELVEALHSRLATIAPLIAEHRQAFDRERRLPHSLFRALADAGLFKLWLPASFGGFELSPLDFMEVVELAASLDGSVGWLVGNGGGMARAAGYLPPEAIRPFAEAPETFIAAATGAVGRAVPVSGGFRISGRWPYASGAPDATLFMALCRIDDASLTTPRNLCCYLPRRDVVLHDTWHVSGLRGTGSYDFDVDAAYVSETMTHPFPEHTPFEPCLLYRLPSLSVFAWTVSVVPLGIARGALENFVAVAETRTRLGTSVPLRDRETIQAMFGRATTRWRAARALLVEAMVNLMAANDEGAAPLMVARADFRAACTFAAETAISIVGELASAAGAIAIFESCPLERALRDVEAAARHVAMAANNYTVAGRIHLGLDPGTLRF